MNITYEFKSERNWNRAYDHLDENNELHFTSYGYKAITVFDERTRDELEAFCTEHRISCKAID